MKDLDEIITEKSPNLLFEEGEAWIRGKGVFIESEPFSGENKLFCGLSLYTLAKPKHEEGINYPDNFLVKTPLCRKTFKDLCNAWATCVTDQEMSERALEFWKPLFNPKGTTTISPLQMYCQRDYKLGVQYDGKYNSTVFRLGNTVWPSETLNYEVKPISFIPERDWFEKDLTSITIYDILSIFGVPEADIFSLCIGRACVGRDGSIPVGRETPLSHKFRTMAVLYGAEPGQGKSTLMEFLIGAMKTVGYTVSNFGEIGRFGLGSIISSSIAYKDDATAAELASLMRSPNLKQMITNATIRTENKGIDSVETSAHAVFIANINHWNPYLIYKLDAGILDRVKILKTLYNSCLSENRENLSASKDSPDLKSRENILYLSKKFGISTNVLMLWFCRLCTEKFLEWMELNPGEGEREIKRLTNSLTCQYNEDASKSIMQAIIFSIIKKKKCESVDEVKNCLFPDKLRQLADKSVIAEGLELFFQILSESSRDERDVIKKIWKAYSRPSAHVWRAISKVNPDSIKFAAAKIRNHDSEDITKSLKDGFSTIKLTNGFGITSVPEILLEEWDFTINYIPDILDLANKTPPFQFKP